MNFKILSVKKRWFSGICIYPFKVKVQLDDGTILDVTSWEPESTIFLYNLSNKVKQSVLGSNRNDKIKNVVGRTFDTNYCYDETRSEVKEREV